MMLHSCASGAAQRTQGHTVQRREPDLKARSISASFGAAARRHGGATRPAALEGDARSAAALLRDVKGTLSSVDITSAEGHVCRNAESPDVSAVPAASLVPDVPPARTQSTSRGRPSSAPAVGRRLLQPPLSTRCPSAASSASGGRAPSRDSQTSRPRSAPRAKSSQEHLRDRKRKDKAQREIKEARLEQSEGEMMYKHLQCLGEANEWAEELGLPTRFRPHKGKDGRLVCHIYEGGTFSREVSLDLFEGRHKALRSRWNVLSLAKADRERAASGASGAAAPTNAAPIALSPGEQATLQRHIRRVTLETLALADKMRQQVAVIETGSKPKTPFVIH